jgi:hypothetical protein
MPCVNSAHSGPLSRITLGVGFVGRLMGDSEMNSQAPSRRAEVSEDRVNQFFKGIVEAYGNGKNAVEVICWNKNRMSIFVLRVTPSYSLAHGWFSVVGTSGEQFFNTPILIEVPTLRNAVKVLDLKLGEFKMTHRPSEPSHKDPRELSSDRKSWSPAVYFIQADNGGPVKIGLAEDIESRIALFQAGCPFRLVCIGMIPDGSRSLEMSLHEQFATTRLHGEWFEDSPELQSYISANAQQIRSN